MRTVDLYLLLPPAAAIVAAALAVIATRRSTARLKRAAAEVAKSASSEGPTNGTPYDPADIARSRPLTDSPSGEKRRLAV